MSSERDMFGPALPPGFKHQNNAPDNGTDSSSDSNESKTCRKKVIGPTLPSGFVSGDTDNNSQSLSCISDDSLCLSASESNDTPSFGHLAPHSLKIKHPVDVENNYSVIGPSLPPGFKLSTESETPGDHLYGPALPPGFQTLSSSESRTSEPSIIGPVLPPHLQNRELHPGKRKGTFSSPALPPGCDKKYDDVSDSDEDDEVVGPLPSEAVDRDAQFDFAADFEKRSKKMKEHLLTQSQSKGSVELKRESWMTDMPDSFGHRLGLKSKGFSHSRAPKVNKKEEEKPMDNISARQLAAKQEDIGKQLEEYNKLKRPKSLLEIHKEKIKKEKMARVDKPQERQPFDRDNDLQIRRMDAKQTKSVLDKAKLVNSRFSHGASHYL